MQRVITVIAAFACAVVVMLGLPYALGGSLCDNTPGGECARNWLNVFIPLLALLAAALAAWAAIGQMSTTKDQLAEIRLTSKRQLRAYLVIEGLAPTLDVPNNRLYGVRFQLLVRSAGQTPGTVFEAYLNKRTIPKGAPMPDGFTATSQGAVSVTIGTGNPQPFGTMSFNRQEIIDQVEGRSQNFIFCHLRYVDVFGETHEALRASEFIFNVHPQVYESLGNDWMDPTKQNGMIQLPTVAGVGHST